MRKIGLQLFLVWKDAENNFLGTFPKINLNLAQKSSQKV